MIFNILAFITGMVAGSLINLYINLPKTNVSFLKWYTGICLRSIKGIIIEMGLGIIYLMLFGIKGFSLEFASFCIIIAVLLAASLKDMQNKTIPNDLVIFALAVGVLMAVLRFSISGVINSLAALLIAGGSLWLVSFFSKGGVGMGDVKLMGCVGLLLGFENTVSIMILSVIASGLAGIIMLITKKLDRKSYMPFAPFIFIGTILAAFLG